MKMYYYKTPRPNFGDELNVWLWSRLLPDFFDEDDRTLFLGIGSILFDFFPPDRRKIVFGSGYAGYTPPPIIDKSWQFYFVRGRLTTNVLGIDRGLAVGDAAILLRSCVELVPQRKYTVSFMPHWQSAVDGTWSEVCNVAGVHYIDPCASVERVLGEIMSSELVITEAMHGAIVSDALRVPWLAIMPIQVKHRMKWFDWASALDISIEPSKLTASNALELSLAITNGSDKWAGRIRNRAQILRRLARDHFVDRAAESLSRIAKITPSLSADTAIERAHETMINKLEILRRGQWKA
jgi:succinoglycan biosynthesis protein ExoV